MFERLSDRAVKLLAAALVAALFALPVSALRWLTAVPGRSHAGALPPLTRTQADMAVRLRRHVEAVARVPHNLAHPQALEDVARYLEATLQRMGYTVRRQRLRVGRHEVRNLEVVVEPAAADAETLVVGAHYDSYGDVPGANDNGSGTAAVLELARRLDDLRGRSGRRIRLVLFVNEEPPYFQTKNMGSLVYARRLKQSGERVFGMMSLETLGCYSDREHSQHYPTPLDLLYPSKGNFVAFVGLTSSRAFVREAIASFRKHAAFPSEGGSAPGFIQGIDWSDHWSFEQIGVPALMVTDTAPFRYRHYHSPTDTPDQLDYRSLARVTAGLER